MNEKDGFEECRRCGRKLRSRRSREVGYGPVCRLRIKLALPVGTTDEKLGKALDLIESGGIVQLEVGRRKNSIFQVVSSRGDQKYLVASMVCTCPAGRRGVTCYHQVAVSVVTA